jgi:N-acetyl-anhydromuramyl-L-alanine amidase AmpD
MPAVSIASRNMTSAQAPIENGRWQAIVIHHSGTAAGTAGDIARQHAAWGLTSLGYHFVIGNGNGEPDGVLLTGPRWTAQEAGAHVADRAAGSTPDAAWFNQHSIGERREFTDAQLKTLARVVEDLQAACGIPDSAVFLHSDLAPVASPGRWFPRAQLALELSN